MTNYDLDFDPDFEMERVIGKKKAMLYLMGFMLVVSIVMMVFGRG